MQTQRDVFLISETKMEDQMINDNCIYLITFLQNITLTF